MNTEIYGRSRTETDFTSGRRSVDSAASAYADRYASSVQRGRDNAEAEQRARRTDRVAQGMRSGSSRVQSVDMSSIETRPARTRTGSSQNQRPVRSSSASAAEQQRRPRTEVSSTQRITRAGSEQARPVRRENTSAEAPRRTRPAASSGQEATAVTVRQQTRPAVQQKKSTAVSNTGTRTTAANRSYSDVMESRRSGSSGSSSGKKGGKKGMSKFSRFLIIYAAILLVIIIVGAIIFNAFLAKSESMQPIHIIEAITEKFRSTDTLTAFLSDYSSVVIRPGGIDSDENFLNNIAGKEISFVADNSSTTTTSCAYKIKADNKTISVVNIAQNGKGDFGLDKWGLASVDISEGFPDLTACSILVPGGSTVTVNGKELTDDMITSSGIPEVLANASKIISDAPEFTTYTFKVVKGTTPDVNAVDSSGAALTLTATEDSYVASPNTASQDFIDSVSSRVNDAAYAYATYFIYMTHDLDTYLKSGTPLYGSIFGDETQDRIDPWLYNWEKIDDYTVSDITAENYVRYADDCFTVDVKYALNVTFVNGEYPDDNQNFDATLVWINDGGTWMVCDMIYR